MNAGVVSSYRGGLDLIKRRAESNVQHVARRQRSLLIGSNPFNSGNEFQRTILIRAIASRRVAFALLLEGGIAILRLRTRAWPTCSPV